MEDAKIIELLFERSETALTCLSDKYGTVIRKTAENILKSTEDAEETINDSLLAVWNTIPPQRPRSLVAYVCRIVRNTALAKHRQNTAKRRNSFFDASLSELEGCIPSALSTEEQCDARQLSNAVEVFLSTLDKDSRAMFVLRYWYNEPVKNIAAMLGISSHTATVRLSRIRGKLKSYLTEKGIMI
ncbi:MAG: sigma-70 family RNA polymerase sigma factor [Eubacterium sp.]|nr:sigma-70 family RNA polymerase sigma factor [Eubacterium sp.]